jgi:hypothetical protein
MSGMKLNDRRLAVEIQRLIDRRIEYTRRNELTRHQYGVVEGAADTVKRTVSVRLYGMAEPTPGFVYSYGLVPRDGDHVRVYIDPRGDHWIDAIQGRDVVSEIVDASTQPPPDSPVDRALNAIARVVLPGGVPDGTVVQLKQIKSDVAVDSLTAVLDATPLAGNLLIGFAMNLSFAQAGDPLHQDAVWPAGWVEVGWRAGVGTTSIAVKTAGPAEPTSINVHNRNVGAFGDCGSLQVIEISGGTFAAALTAQASGTTVALPGATVALPSFLVAFAQETNAWARVSDPAGYDFLDEIAPNNGSNSHLQTIWTRSVGVGGPYGGTVGYAASASVVTAQLALTGVPTPDLAPEIVDGDDATWHAGELEEAVRLDLRAAYRIVRARILIGCNIAGAKSYALRAANQPDFSDEVTVATASFTSVGGFAANDIPLLWASTTSYRYWRLVGPAEARRIYTVELYEAAPNQVVVTDPGTGAGGNIDDVLASLLTEVGALDIALQDLIDKELGYLDHGSTGSTETFSAAIGWHRATLDDDLTITLTGATAGLVSAVVLELVQDWSGGWSVSWPGSVVWPVATPPTLSTDPDAVDIITLFSHDGGSTWYGFSTGGSGPAVAADISFTPAGTISATDVQAAIEEVAAEAASATEILDIPTAETDTTLVLSPDGAGGVEFRPEAGGSGPTPSYLGTTSIGASVDTPAVNGFMVAKQIVIPADCWIDSIDFYTTTAVGTVGPSACALYDDVSGAPVHPLLLGGANNAQESSQAHWDCLPFGFWVPAGTYWAVIRNSDAGGGVFSKISYDAGGSDRKANANAAFLNWGSMGPSTTTRDYSIRVHILTF